MSIKSFKRVEKKYMIDEEQKIELLKILYNHMELDIYCRNENTYRIQNIYYDTENNDLISKSINKPSFKQKIRVRKYDTMDDCFLEIKKKCDGVVGKRRITLSLQEIDDFINKRIKPHRTSFIDNSVIGEIDYLLSQYKIVPKVYISYERLGLFDRENKELRITFDNHIHTKRNNLEFDKDDYERDLLPEGLYIMEIKSTVNFPLWLVKELSRLKIYPHSFSKYGEEYKLLIKEGDLHGIF